MDQKKRIIEIEKSVNGNRKIAYKVPHEAVESLSCLEQGLFSDYCIFQNRNVEIVNDPDEEKTYALFDDLISGKLSQDDFRQEYRKLHPAPTDQEIGQALHRLKQHPFDVEKWLEKVSV